MNKKRSLIIAMACLIIVFIALVVWSRAEAGTCMSLPCDAAGDPLIDNTTATMSNIAASSLKAVTPFVDEQCITYEATGDGFEPVSCGTPGTLTRQCKTLFDPIDADSPVFGIGAAWTVDRITYFCSGGTSVAFTLQECDNQAANCSAIEATITCTAGAAVGNVSTTNIDNRSIDADDIIKLDIGTVTGTVDYITVCIEESL